MRRERKNVCYCTQNKKKGKEGVVFLNEKKRAFTLKTVNQTERK